MRIISAILTLAAALLAVSCVSEPRAEERRPAVRLVRDSSVGGLAEAFAAAQDESDLELELLQAIGSIRTVAALQRDEADVGFAQADVVYSAHRHVAQNPDSALHQIQGIAALHITSLHLLARPESPIQSVEDLRNYTVRTGIEAVTGQELFAELVLRAHGVDPEALDRRRFLSLSLPDELVKGTVDAGFTTAYYPADKVAMAMSRGARLISIDGPSVQDLMREFPFVRRVSIPAHTYPRQPQRVRTIGVDRVLVCRSDLSESVVHDLTQQFLETLPKISSSLHTSLRLMSLEEAAATPIPLHNGAARYYRERELTP